MILHYSSAEFECAALDCPEWLGHQANPGCYFTYESDKCCSIGETCRKLKSPAQQLVSQI